MRKLRVLLLLTVASAVGISAVVLMGVGRGPERHCSIVISPVQPGESASKMSDLRCFDSFADLISYESNGAVQVPQNFHPRDVTESELQSMFRGSGETVIGIDYKNSNFGGDSLPWIADNLVGCSTGLSYQAPSMPSGWNDEVSSADAFAGCDSYIHYEDNNYGGSQHECAPDCATIGVMNDETSSEKWFP